MFWIDFLYVLNPSLSNRILSKTALLLFYNLVTFSYREWTCNIKFVSSLGANVLIIKQKRLGNFVIKPMHRHQRQLREGKLMRLYPFVGPIPNVITLKLFLDLGIWSSHRSRVGSWDVQVSRISNIEFTIFRSAWISKGSVPKNSLRGSTVRLNTTWRETGEGSFSKLTHSLSKQIFSVPICYWFVSQMTCVRTRMQIHISMEAPGLLVTASTVTVTMALSRVLKRCQSLHPMTETLSAVVNRIVT